ncbi:MAG TPA: SDR family oxidoreductase [Demequina sp.]|nr:SDR family oxidoreductase [Demequina sp.]
MMAPPAPRTALITGASRGIGRHLALGFAAAGLDVGLIATSPDGLAGVAAEIASACDARVVTVAADVTREVDVVRAVAEVTRGLGSIDVLVNNAGRVDAEVPLWEADPEEWWDVVAVNVRGPFLLAHAVVPGMLAGGGGRVIDINSGSGTRDFATSTGYTASKSALFRIGGALHEAGFALGLRAFEMAPGVVRTDMTGSMAMHAGRTQWTDPADVVALALALARGEGDHLSGSYLRVGLDRPEELRSRGSAQRLGLVPSEARKFSG